MLIKYTKRIDLFSQHLCIIIPATEKKTQNAIDSFLKKSLISLSSFVFVVRAFNHAFEAIILNSFTIMA